MLNKIKSWYGITDNSKDAIIQIMIDNATAFISSYCGDAAFAGVDTIIFKMVLEDYNKKGMEGISWTTLGGVGETAITDYSPTIYTLLKPHRKIKLI